MALDQSRISAHEYDTLRTNVPGDMFEQLSNEMVSGMLGSTYPSEPSLPLSLPIHSNDEAMLRGVDVVFEDIMTALACAAKNKAKLKKALNVVLTNLLSRYFAYPTCYTRVSRNKNNYNIPARYNNQGAGYNSMIAAVSGLVECGYLGQMLGSRNPETNTGKQTRIWPTAKLTEIFKANHSIGWDNFKDLDVGETIIPKDGDKNEIDYEDDAITNKMRATLDTYSKLLRTSDIPFPSNNSEVQKALEGGHLIFRSDIVRGKSDLTIS